MTLLQMRQKNRTKQHYLFELCAAPTIYQLDSKEKTEMLELMRFAGVVVYLTTKQGCFESIKELTDTNHRFILSFRTTLQKKADKITSMFLLSQI